MTENMLFKIREICDDEGTHARVEEFDDCFAIEAPDMGDPWGGSYIPFCEMDVGDILEEELSLEEVDDYKPYMERHNLKFDNSNLGSELFIYKKN